MGANVKRQKGRSCSYGARSPGREQPGGWVSVERWEGTSCQMALGLEGEQRRACGDFSLRSKVSKGCHQRKKYFLYFSGWNKHRVKNFLESRKAGFRFENPSLQEENFSNQMGSHVPGKGGVRLQHRNEAASSEDSSDMETSAISSWRMKENPGNRRGSPVRPWPPLKACVAPTRRMDDS